MCALTCRCRVVSGPLWGILGLLPARFPWGGNSRLCAHFTVAPSTLGGSVGNSRFIEGWVPTGGATLCVLSREPALDNLEVVASWVPLVGWQQVLCTLPSSSIYIPRISVELQVCCRLGLHWQGRAVPVALTHELVCALSHSGEVCH